MGNEVNEIQYALKSHPEGTFKLFHGTGAGIEENIEQHLSNWDVINQKITHAFYSGCFIEVISLRLQVMDFWLRIFFLNKSSGEENRKREFGALLQQCYKLGLAKDKRLYDNIQNFNSNRVKIIHGFVVGAIDYNSLEEVAINSKSLMKELMVFVIENSGKVITNIEGMHFQVGDMIINVARAIEKE